MCRRSFVWSHLTLMFCGLMLLQLYPGVRPAHADSRIVKCTSASGRVSFSQTGCEQGIRESIKVENPEIGWINLEKVVSKFKASPDKDEEKQPKRKGSGTRAGVRAQKQRCWSARKNVARIARELKQGYRLARGEELRYQRIEQEEYLKLFCKK